MSKRTKVRKVKSTDNFERRAKRLAYQLFCYRYVEDGDTSPMETHYDYRGIMPTYKKAVLHNLTLTLRLHWQCISITYCRDANGKKYRLFGFSQTMSSIVAAKDGIVPLMTAAIKDGESTANTKHIYARGMVVAPWSREFSDMVPLLKRKKKFLQLQDSDIEALRDYRELKFQVYEYDVEELLDIDRQIANLLR